MNKVAGTSTRFASSSCIHVQIDQALGVVHYYYAWNKRGEERNLPPLKLAFNLPGITVGWAEFDALIYGWAYLSKNGLSDCFLYTYNHCAYNYAKSLSLSPSTRSSGLDERIIRGNPLLLKRFKRNLTALAKEPKLAKARIWNGEKWGLNPATKSALKHAENHWARLRKLST